MSVVSEVEAVCESKTVDCRVGHWHRVSQVESRSKFEVGSTKFKNVDLESAFTSGRGCVAYLETF